MTPNYTDHVGQAHRKKFGQFFTHPAVARFMVRWVSESGSSHIFDPAFGLGEFYIHTAEGDKSTFTAMEIDPAILGFWRESSENRGSFVTQGDYLHTWGQKHRNIVCNPPYMRFQKFLNRDAVSAEFQNHLGVRLSGYTNTASAFLLKSLSELESGGRLAYIMPLEFLNTGYGSLVKERLLAHKHLFGIISFDCEKHIFPDATTSVGIILFDSSREYETVKFYSFDNLDTLDKFTEATPVSEVDQSSIEPTEKWLPYFTKKTFDINGRNTTALKFYGRFSRGIATGANEFFALNRTKIAALNLQEERDCTPCIIRSSQIKGSFFELEDFKLLKSEDKPVFLFSVNDKHSVEAELYIKEGELKGYHKRFLTKNRNPWYKTETRESAPLLIGVFSRGGYKIIRNRSGALNLTCYHGFQPNLFGVNYLDHLFLYLSSKVGREVVSLVSRKYGDSLDKFEPNDINEALVPTPGLFDAISHQQIQEALTQFRKSNGIPLWLEVRFEEIRMPD